ncbi:HNH endonuclease signature motif containing protein [Cryobacterium psychrophilum]|uniref:HNH endonuclease n=1 Tax=Cryobacterium psychrophilum TaxID=41988 RepID=A0A4Y8KYA5_9MICO|nr:HNH endonuclease signature motif containing protein [Cryobacterium psychrophilum]TDW28702.1 uncharacterized protein DUF222 [Cryobacterium psychrophilum]TFD82361.1 HNH endonuclease [Cryobacterium psychrophilum]
MEGLSGTIRVGQAADAVADVMGDRSGVPTRSLSPALAVGPRRRSVRVLSAGAVVAAEESGRSFTRPAAPSAARPAMPIVPPVAPASATTGDVGSELARAITAVNALGCSSAAYEVLTDAAAIAGQRLIADARRLLDTRAAWMAASIARRSRPELGHSGLAAKRGFVNPEDMIQQVTGSTRGEATTLISVGTLLAETEAVDKLVQDAIDNPDPGRALVTVPWQAPIGHAVSSGMLSIAKADGIRKGLGNIDTAITAEKLGEALELLLHEAEALNADQLFKRARRLRDRLNEASIAAGEKAARDQRYWRVWRQRDGMVRSSALLAPEEGEFVLSAYETATSPRRTGVRFVDPEQASWADALLKDPRTLDQIAADALVQMLRLAGEAESADPRDYQLGQGHPKGRLAARVFGGRRPAVRVMVTQKTLTDGSGFGQLEGNPASISWESIDRNLCDTGTVGVMFSDDGQCVNVGRDSRLFTLRQRLGLAVRDGGCRWPDCTRPASWTEAHHINHWKAHNGKTDIADGISLCKFHHLLLHNNGWQIFCNGGQYWLRPPPDVDGQQRRIAMPSKNALILNEYGSNDDTSPPVGASRTG